MTECSDAYLLVNQGETFGSGPGEDYPYNDLLRKLDLFHSL